MEGGREGGADRWQSKSPKRVYPRQKRKGTRGKEVYEQVV